VKARGADATPLAGVEMLFDYHLPPDLIAQQPAAERDRSRLMVVRRTPGTIGHHVFADLPDLLTPGDLLVLNDTRVIPARLVGRRARTGGKWEGLFLHETADGLWELMSQTRGRLAPGETVVVEPGELQLTLVRQTPERRWVARPHEAGPAFDLLRRHGQVPLPPYVRKGRAIAEDSERYQTVYARQPGAVAAPTAGLHFTPDVFERLGGRGVGRAFVTLHVGEGTFAPIKVDDITQHQMHREWGEMSGDTAAQVAACRQRGGRVVAVGTTSVRVLETVAATGPPRPWSGETELFIYPPYPFRLVDALVTNFHLPRTSLLCLVSAFAGADLIRHAYETAVAERYRFYSYGDAMLIL
ncbi:MAG TPA: tRNA preQ1(34) S-adenosylmethionine ribosyltransferase-isomerase QueA, partial [Gemmataceae bacterium]|nr:tRNA preQ1(34) S-adenosylmethionine ribosyltransferase-isomerase QueA [Gemmataceae bacterium]